MDGQTDDLEKIHRLVFESRRRYRSARANITHKLDATVAKEANERFIDWRFDQEGGSGIARVGATRSAREDFYTGYEEVEETIRLWHENPEFWREEIWSSDGKLLECNVAQTGGPWWLYHPISEVPAIYRPTVPTDGRPQMRFWFMLNPSDEIFQQELLDEATFHVTGRQTAVAGRKAIEVRADTISWSYPARIFHVFDAHLEGTTDHTLLIDAEIGTILRTAARLEGREYRVAEVTEISYDEQFPDATFRLELPGVEFEQFDLPDYES